MIQKKLTKDDIRKILSNPNRPEGASDRDIVSRLLQRGHTIEGLDIKPKVEPKKEPEKEERGGISGFFRDILKPAVTIAARPFQLGMALAGKTEEEQKLDLPFFGEIGTVTSGRDVLRDIGRGAETVALGVGGGAVGAIGKQTLKQLGIQAFKTGIRGGAKAGLLAGAGRQLREEGEIGGKTLLSGLAGAGIGGLTGGVLGGTAGVAGAGIRGVTRAGLRRAPERALPKFLRPLQEKTRMQDAIEITRPVLSKKERIQALARGRGEETRQLLPQRFRGIKIKKPSKRDTDVAKSVTGIVQKGRGELQNMDEISKAVTRKDAGIESTLKQNNIMFNKNQLNARLRKAKEGSKVIFSGDKTLESRYNAIINELTDSIKKNNLTGLFSARKTFDKTVRAKFPRTFDGNPSDNVTKNAILDVRREVNEFIGDHLPKGNKFIGDLRQEHLMLNAVENIAEQAEIKTRDSKFINTILAGIGFGALGAIGGLGIATLRGGGGGD